MSWEKKWNVPYDVIRWGKENEWFVLHNKVEKEEI